MSDAIEQYFDGDQQISREFHPSQNGVSGPPQRSIARSLFSRDKTSVYCLRHL